MGHSGWPTAFLIRQLYGHLYGIVHHSTGSIRNVFICDGCSVYVAAMLLQHLT